MTCCSDITAAERKRIVRRLRNRARHLARVRTIARLVHRGRVDVWALAIAEMNAAADALERESAKGTE